MGLKKNLSRVLSMVMSGVMCLSLVSPAFAATTATAAATTSPVSTSTSNLHQVKESFLDAYDGSKLANDATYSVTHEEKNPQKIEGYSYRDYSEEVQQIYTHKDLPYIQGYPDKTVRPERYLSRCEAVAIFYRLYDGEYPSSINTGMTDKTFSDVPANAWYYNELSKMYQIGLVNGDGGRFRPNDPITRAELTALATRFNAEKFGKPSASFNDVSSSSWYYNSVSVAEANGWVSGYPDGTFRPDNYISRAETMTIINRTINRSVTIDRLNQLHVANPYIDISENHWAYTQVIEASIRHSGKDWHGLNYNGGVYNIIVEKFVDDNGKEIAPAVTSNARNEFTGSDIKNFPPYENIGYIRILTYSYTKGDALPTITKTADKNTVKSGDILTYTIKVANGAAAVGPFESVVVSDQLPEALTFNDNTVYVDGTSSTYTYENGKLSVNIGDIAPGATKTVVFQTTVKSGYDGTKIENVAVATGKNGDASDVSYSSSASASVNPGETPTPGGGTTPAPGPGVIVEKGKAEPYATKTVDKNVVNVGDTVTYTITYGNASTAEYKVENAVLTDEIPEELELVPGSVYINNSSVTYSYDKATQTLSVKLGDLAVDSSKVLKFSATVKAEMYDRTVKNVAVLSGDNITSVNAPEENGVRINDGNVLPFASKIADKSVVNVGDTVSYTVTVGNGKDAKGTVKNAVLTDVIPEELVFATSGFVYVDGVSTQHKYDKASHTLTVQLGDLAPGTTHEVKYSAVVADDTYGKTILNVAVLDGKVDGKDMEPVKAVDSINDGNGIPVNNGDIQIVGSKVASKETVSVGETYTYTINVKNNSESSDAAKNVVVSDALPEGLIYDGKVTIDNIAVGYPDVKYNVATRTVSVNLGDMQKGEEIAVGFDVTVDSTMYNKVVKNVAVVNGDNFEPVEMPDQTNTGNGVNVNDGAVKPTVTKSANVESANVGDTIIYTVRVENGEDAEVAMENITITDVLPEYTEYVYGSVLNDKHCTCLGFDTDTNTLSFKAEKLEPGQATEFQFAVKVVGDAYGKDILNVAVVDGDNFGPIEARDTTNNGEGIPVGEGETALTAEKVASKSTVSVGETYTYTINVANGKDAEAAAKNVVLSDVVPEGLIFAGKLFVNNVAVVYSYDSDSRTLTIPVGDLTPNSSATVKFDVIVDNGMYGENIKNVAVIDADNADPVEAPDQTNSGDGVKVNDGAVKPSVTKSANKDAVKVGDQIVYTVRVENGEDAEVAMTGITMTDVLPDEVSYVYGSQRISDNCTRCNFNDASKTLTLTIDKLEPGESAEFQFAVTVNDDTYGKIIKNVAVVDGDNFGPIEAPDTTNNGDGIPVENGTIALSATKVANKETVSVGETYTYTINIANGKDAQTSAKNVVFTDTIPAGLTFTGNVLVNNASAQYTYDKANALLTVEVGEIAPGAESVVSFDVVVAQGMYNETIKNVGVVSADDTDPIEVPEQTNSGEGTHVNEGEAIPSIVKTASTKNARYDDIIVYNIVVSNSDKAQVPVRNAVITDVIPEGLEFMNGSVRLADTGANDFNYNDETKTLTINAGDIAPGESKSYEFSVRVRDAFGMEIYNTATLDGDNIDPIDGQTVDPVDVDKGIVDLSATKVANKETVSVGETFTYTITIANGKSAETAAKNVVFTDAIPAGLTFAGNVLLNNGNSAQYTYDKDSALLTVEVGDIERDAQAVLSFDVVVDQGMYNETVKNVGTVDADNTDPFDVPEDTGSGDGVHVNDGEAVPAIVKTANVKEAKKDDIIVYTVVVSNDKLAQVPVRNAVITDVIPDGLEFMNGSVRLADTGSNEFNYNDETKTLTINAGDIAPGESKSYEFSVRVLDALGQEIYNTATLDGDNVDPIDGETVDPVDIDGGTVDLSATKVANKETVSVGETYTYTINIANGKAADTAAKNVVFTDAIPAGLVFAGNVLVNNVASNYSYDSASALLTVEVGDIDRGANAVITFDVVVDKGMYNETIKNVGTVDADNADPFDVPEDTNTGDGIHVSDGSAVPAIVKTANTKTAKKDDIIIYNVVVSNSNIAQVPVRNATITDVIPEDLEFVNGSVRLDDAAYGDFGYNDETKTLTINVGDIAPGESKHYEFSVRVGDAFGKEIYNIATLDGDNIDPMDAKTVDSLDVEDGVVNAKLVKVSDKATAEVGDVINYRVVFTNDGLSQDAARNAVMTDAIPEGCDFQFGSVRIDGKVAEYSFNADENTVTVPLGDVAPGRSAEIEFAVRINADAYGEKIINVANADADNIDPLEATDASGVNIGDGATVPEITKEVNKTEAEVGDVLTYTITASNKAIAQVPVRNAHVIDILPEYLDFTGGVTVDGAAADYTYDPDSRTIDVSLGDIAPGTSAKIMYQASVNKNAYGAYVENTATLKGDNTDPEQDTAAVDIADGVTDLKIKKQVSSKKVKVGDEIVYTVTVSNGPGATAKLYNVHVEDTLPEFVTFSNLYIDGHASQSYTYENGTIGVDFIDMDPGASRVITIHAFVNANAYGKTFENVAVAKADNADPVKDSDKNNPPTDGPGKPGDPVVVEKGEPVINASKVANKSEVKVGDTITYTVTFENKSSATSAYTNVPYDVIPDGLTYAGNVSRDGKSTNDFQWVSAEKTLYFKFDSLEPGEKTVYTFDATVNPNATEANIQNKLFVPNGNDPDAPNIVIPEGSTPTISDDVKPAPKVEKTVDNATPAAGDMIHYTVKIENESAPGAATWRNVTLVDRLPAGVSYVSEYNQDGTRMVTFDDDANVVQGYVGDVEPGQVITISYSAQVGPTVATGTKLTNVATAIGDNGSDSAKATVTVSKGTTPGSTEITHDEEGWNQPPVITKTVDKTTINMGQNRDATFTITMTNPAENTQSWKNVIVTDHLNSAAILYKDDIFLNNAVVKNFTYEELGEYSSFDLTVPIGDIAPGQTKTLKFTVEFGSDAEGTKWVNKAVATSDNYSDLDADAPMITFIGNAPNNISPGPYHLQIYTGFATTNHLYMAPYFTNDFQGTVDPTASYPRFKGITSPGDVATTLWRGIPRERRTEILREKNTSLGIINSLPKIQTPDGFALMDAWMNAQTVKAMVAIGALEPYERDGYTAYTSGSTVNAKSPYRTGQFFTYEWGDHQYLSGGVSRDQIGRMLSALHLPQGNSSLGYTNPQFATVYTDRFTWGCEVLDIFGRDHTPDITSYLVADSDAPKQFDDDEIVKSSDRLEYIEMTNRHIFMKDRANNEYWIRIDPRNLTYEIFTDN